MGQQTTQPPRTFQLTFPDAKHCDLGGDQRVVDLLHECGTELCDAQRWCASASEWEHCLSEFSLTGGAPMLLFRTKEMFCRHFAHEVRRLEEEAPATRVGRKKAKAEGKAAWADAINREHVEGYVYVVFWYKV